MTLQRLVAICLVCGLSSSLLGCHRSSSKSTTPKEATPAVASVSLLPVTRIDCPATVSAGTFFYAVVVGQLPDPAWHWTRNELSTASAKVMMRVMGERPPHAMAAQVLTEYKAPQRIRKLKPGRLTLVAIGRDGSVTREVDVQPARPSR